MQRSVNTFQWDIFCKVIDNFGDIGICWRLAADLASRGQRVRLWVDDGSALAWMAPLGCDGVQVLPWSVALRPADLHSVEAAPPDVMIEAFGCQIAPEFLGACRALGIDSEKEPQRGQFLPDLQAHSPAMGQKAGEKWTAAALLQPMLPKSDRLLATCARIQGATDQKPIHQAARPVWINLEYLSAEPYAERNHGLPSLVQCGPAAGWTKWFFYPGFSAQTGGLLREPNLAARQAAFDRTTWLHAHGVEAVESIETTLVSLFCYEPPLLAALLHQWAKSGINGKPVHLLVASGRATGAVWAAWGKNDLKNTTFNHIKQPQPNEYGRGQLSISYLPLLSQTDFDHLLWACDINFVRGEDSIVRAIWAGKPFVWQIYPQDDGVHSVKLDTFLDMLGASGSTPPSLREFHRRWNAPDAGVAATRPWQTGDLTVWQQTVSGARARLMANLDLSSSLMEFVSKNR